MKDEGKIFTNKIFVLILSILLYSNISYSSNIFDSYSKEGILNINQEKITYKNGTEQEQDIDYEGNQISLDTELIQSIFGNTTEGSLDYNYFMYSKNFQISKNTDVNKIGENGLLFTGKDTYISNTSPSVKFKIYFTKTDSLLLWLG